MSSTLSRFEKKVISSGTDTVKHLAATAIEALSDYKYRHLGAQAASVSFYAIFSIFPLLAFTVFLVSRLIGDESLHQSTPLVLTILREFVPTMQRWIEKGLFDTIGGQAANSWVNGALLAWSGLGLFESVLDGIESLPGKHGHLHRALITQLFLAIATLGLFVLFITTVVFCEVVGASPVVPSWLQSLPFAVQDTLYYGAQSRALLVVVSVGIVMMTYKFLLPVPVSLRAAFVGAATFTGLVLLSRSAYWIYLHYNRHDIESTYGVFSALILNMLWLYFTVSCLLYGGLFALHLDRAKRLAGRRQGGASGHSGGHSGSSERRQAA